MSAATGPVARDAQGAVAPAGLADPPRPMFRGVLHFITAMLAPFATVALLLLADSPRGYVGASIFGTTLMLLYMSSANYHLAPWPASLRGLWKRVDHAMIFVLIAGTYTPLCLVVLNNAWGIPMLAVVWTLAGAGVALKVVNPNAPRWLSVGLYMGIGWVGVVAATEVVTTLPAAALAMLVAGGALYTIGGVIYARRRPDPSPRWFGFHEVFHAFVIAGSAAHFALISIYVV
ncbi:MAG: hemolysin III family protein [Chloroflexi bacterium]|nr:hemolysin III family protein [Chloroflexota bacterium]